VIPYADSNFFARLYLELPGSDEARLMLEQLGSAGEVALVPVTFLHRLEVLNATQMYVYLVRQGGKTRVTAESAAAARALFDEDILHKTFVRPVSLDLEALMELFEEVALRHTAKEGFRTYDIVHVASALLLGCDTFWSLDVKAKKLAKLEGLDCWDLPF
jgi:predicted nucleic acid-binding protein